MTSAHSSLEILPIGGLPEICAGTRLASSIVEASAKGAPLASGDIVVIAQKIVSKSEGRMRLLGSVTPGERAMTLAQTCRKDPRLVELILSESEQVVRCAPDILIVRHRLGFIVANAAIDQSNVPDGDESALLLPIDPDRSAREIGEALSEMVGGPIGVVINDSFGRPWRRGTCGVAIGCWGIEALVDLRGRLGRFGRPLRSSEVATGDEIAAAASLVMGQAGEGIPVAIVRGLPRPAKTNSARTLIRSPEQNLFM